MREEIRYTPVIYAPSPLNIGCMATPGMEENTAFGLLFFYYVHNVKLVFTTCKLATSRTSARYDIASSDFQRLIK